MGERRGTKGLELWCRKMTEGYPGVKIDNMTTSWRDGLAFCAIIHHFRPDLIDFSKLNKNDIYHNNELAFRVAEQYLGIPALLEPEDMVEFPVPDRLSILTYLSQFYQAFAVPQGSAATRIPAKRPQTATDHGIVSPASTSPPTKSTIKAATIAAEKTLKKSLLNELKTIANSGTGGKIRREPCAKCDLPVFIAERLNVGKQLYHRTCFRCARCDSQLTLANYYETENNEFCCEMCPDEEKSRVGTEVDKSILARSMSDEEKSALNKLKYTNEDDEYSSQFESALENASDSALKKSFTLTPEKSSRYMQARSEFFESQIGDSDTESDVPPDLPNSKPPITDIINENSVVSNKSEFDSSFPTIELDSSVNSVSDTVNIDNKLLEEEKVVTKDVDNEENSIVKSRMRLFENNAKSEDVNKEPVPLELPQDSQETQSSLDNDSNKHSEQDNVLDVDHSVTTISDDSNIEQKDDSVIVIDDSTASEAKIDVEVTEFIDDEENSLKIVEDIKQDVIPVSNISNEESKLEPKEEISPILPIPRRHKKKAQKQLSYPEDLNPFGDDEPEQSRISLNPFGDEDEDEEEPPSKPVPSPRTRRKIIPTEPLANTPGSKSSFTRLSVNPFNDDDEDLDGKPNIRRRKITPTKPLVNTPGSKSSFTRISVNPFEDDDEDLDGKTPLPSERRKVIKAPKISLNPFGSEDEEEDEEENVKLPVPIPRYSGRVPEPRPRSESGTTGGSSSLGGSHSSLASGNSNTFRKKKLAPKPPSSIKSDATESGHSSLTSSPSQSVAPSPRLNPKYRKSKKAPLPPTSTPIPKITETSADLDTAKSAKDEMNRNRQSQNFNVNSPSSSETSSSLCTPNKSTYGKWKRRKGQAPQRPIPQRRTIKALPIAEIRRELEVIEIQQQGLEKQGVMIEQLIRERSENNTNPDEPLSADVEDLILQLFELVNEKNELFRKQTELMYLRRQQRLEEEHADVEYQIRCLMLQPEANKTDSDKAREEELINRLVDIVERRNEIIECLEMDRVREAQEDDSINNQMNIYTSKLEEERTPSEEKPKKDKKKHKLTKEKIKEKLFRKDKEKDNKVDVDKDIDESEPPKSKEKKKKKKLNIF